MKKPKTQRERINRLESILGAEHEKEVTNDDIMCELIKIRQHMIDFSRRLSVVVRNTTPQEPKKQ